MRLRFRGSEPPPGPAGRSGAEKDKALQARLARTAKRRDASRERDAARYAHAEALAGGARWTIPADEGFLVLPPGRLEGADEVVAAGNALIDEIGPDALMRGDSKGGFMAKHFLPPSATELDSPYMRLALSEAVVAPIAAYLGFVPILDEIDLWFSFHGGLKEPKSSQRWHLDHADTTQVKVWLHLSDVTRESGPLTAIGAATSQGIAERIGYDFNEGRVDDDQIDEEVGEDGVTRFEGAVGTVDFVDSSRCFHFGSRVEAGAMPRRLFFAQYLTPYAFQFKGDHREHAAYRHLAGGGSSELERLLLGAE